MTRLRDSAWPIADALPVEAFDAYGATARTLRSFIGSYQELLRKVTDSLIPDPDVRR
jgi:hypothetical protein